MRSSNSGGGGNSVVQHRNPLFSGILTTFSPHEIKLCITDDLSHSTWLETNKTHLKYSTLKASYKPSIIQYACNFTYIHIHIYSFIQNQVHQISGLKKRRDKESVNGHLCRVLCESTCSIVNQNCTNPYLSELLRDQETLCGDFYTRYELCVKCQCLVSAIFLLRSTRLLNNGDKPVLMIYI